MTAGTSAPSSPTKPCSASRLSLGGASGFAAIEEVVTEAVAFAKERIPGVGN